MTQNRAHEGEIDRGEPDYADAGQLLRDYGEGRLSDNEAAARINERLAREPVVWRLWSQYEKAPPKYGRRLVLDQGGWESPWRLLARLLGDGVTLGRLRVCRRPKCGRLFYDASAPGRRTTCSKRCKDVLASRNYRARLA